MNMVTMIWFFEVVSCYTGGSRKDGRLWISCLLSVTPYCHMLTFLSFLQ